MTVTELERQIASVKRKHNLARDKELAPLKRLLLAEKRKSAPKVGRLKVRQFPKRKRVKEPKEYREYLDNATHCLSCGWRPGDPSPPWYPIPMRLERAHFVSSAYKRKLDPSVVILLCSSCHAHSHSPIANCPYPRLTKEDMVKLKRKYESTN